MSIYKRENVWWLDITTPNGQRIRRTTGTSIKKNAQEYHDKLKAELWQIDKLNNKPKYYFEDALLLYIKYAEELKDKASKKLHANYWRKQFAHRELSSLTTQEIIEKAPIYNQSTGEILSNSTQNKYLKSLARILNLAYQSGYIDNRPYIPKKKEPPIRVRWITKDKAKQLISLMSREWMRNICLFALLTGARRKEIITMTWDKIDFERKIAIVSNDIAKSEKARSLLLNDEAIALLHKQKGKHPQFVFVSSTGRMLQDVNRKAFDLATRKCGLIDFHFHDLRHTWASWHVQAGTPLFTLKELGGWETLEMVKKYAHLNADHLMIHANNVAFHDTNTTQ